MRIWLDSLASRCDGYNLVFFAWWADYEEDGWVVIGEKDGRYYCQEGGYSVMDFTHPEPVWNPWPIDEDEALRLMELWENDEDYSIETIQELFDKRILT
jgi:hypothetical protein